MELCLNSCSEGKVWSGGNPLCPVVKEEVTIFFGDLAGEDQVLNCDVEQFGEGLEEF